MATPDRHPLSFAHRLGDGRSRHKVWSPDGRWTETLTVTMPGGWQIHATTSPEGSGETTSGTIRRIDGSLLTVVRRREDNRMSVAVRDGRRQVTYSGSCNEGDADRTLILAADGVPVGVVALPPRF